ncbi:MAG TPA: ThuA domain-containing protein [Tepidisphaeraceae bacterium]|jgi:trehalose utilization protein
MSIRVTIWHEHRHEKKHKAVSDLYPEGMHGQLARHLRTQEGLEVGLATLDDPEHGLTDEVIAGTDVMIWWGHGYHNEVGDDIVDKVHRRCLAGMGLIVLHSAHYSKIFRRLMGTTCDLKWRVGEDREILWVTKAGHPILAGIDDHFVLDREEMYGEGFDVPTPEETLLISTFSGGECFRSGLTWTRGAGKIFYFRPGHETYRSYYDPNVLRVITNAVRWARPVDGGRIPPGCVNKPKAGWV